MRDLALSPGPMAERLLFRVGDAAADRPRPSLAPEAQATLRLQIVTDWRCLEPLREAWDALHARSRDGLASQSYDWCSCAWETLSVPRGRELLCVVGYEGDRLVLVWPLVTYRARFWRIVRPLGPETTEYGAVLVEAGPVADQHVAKAWRFVASECNADVILLPPVPTGTALHDALTAAPLFHAAFRDRLSLVRLRGIEWDAYHGTLSGDMRRRMRRHRRQLDALGRYESRVAGTAESRQEIVDWLLRQKRRWLEKTGRQSAWLNSEEYADFHAGIATREGLAARYVFLALKLQGRIIAAALLGIDKLRVEGCQIAFDPDFAKYSPGQLLLEDCLKWAHASGRDFDLRIGDEPYKRHWVTETSAAIAYRIAGSPWGSTYVAFVMARQGIEALQVAARRRLPPPLLAALRRMKRGGKSTAPPAEGAADIEPAPPTMRPAHGT